jgi:MSHA biogenesis protein MshJ
MSGIVRRVTSLLLERFRAFSLRERALIAVTGLAVTWGSWAATVGGYLDASERRVEGSVSAVEQRLQAALAESSRLHVARSADPNEALLLERKRLDARLGEMSASLGDLLDRFVDPQRMPALLEDVIRQHRNLTLTRIESLPVEPLDVSAPAEDGEQAVPVWIYRHPLQLEFEGRYFDVMAYLAELEQGPWRFGWRQLDYQVRDYPVARVTLEIETLSREKNWIGV